MQKSKKSFTQRRNAATKGFLNKLLVLGFKRCVVASSREAGLALYLAHILQRIK